MSATLSTFRELETMAERAHEVGNTVGCAFALYHRGELHTHAHGVGNLAHPAPVRVGTMHQIGSVSKLYTATAIVVAHKRGLVDLDAPITDVLPDLKLSVREGVQAVTLRHLISHTSGLFGDEYHDTSDDDRALELLMPQMASVRQIAPVGGPGSYCHTGFYIAGRALEVAAQAPFHRAISRLVFEPADLDATYLARDVVTRGFTVGHVGKDHALAEPWCVPRCMHPMAGVITTITSLVDFGRLHLGADQPLGDLGAMAEPVSRFDGARSIGLGWFIQGIDGEDDIRVLSHAGRTVGQLARLIVVPNRELVFAFVANADSAAELGDALVSSALERCCEIRLNQSEPELSTLSETAAAEYIGSYLGHIVDVHIEVDTAGQLVAQIIPKIGFPTPSDPIPPTPEPCQLGFTGPDQFRVLDGVMAGSIGSFGRDASRRVVWMRSNGRLYTRQGAERSTSDRKLGST